MAIATWFSLNGSRSSISEPLLLRKWISVCSPALQKREILGYIFHIEYCSPGHVHAHSERAGGF